MQNSKINILLQKQYGLGLIAIASTIPFWMLFNNICIIYTVIISLVILFRRKIKPKFNQTSLLFIFFYFFLAVSLFYSEDKEYGFSVLSRTLLFVVFSIIFSFGSELITKKIYNQILNYFVLSCILSSFLCLAAALYSTIEYASVNPFNTSNGNFFSYINLTQILKAHPIYYGTYIVFSLFILSYDLLKPSPIINIKTNWRFFLIIYFIGFSLLLNSFIIIIIEILLGIILMYKLFTLKRKTLNKNKIMIWLILLSFTVYFSSNFISEKMKGVHVINDLTTTNFSGQQFTALKARRAKAYCSIDLIKNNFWTGVGIGDGPSELLKYYKKNGFLHGVERKFNSHNQFLTTFIYLGVFGFLLLLFIISFLFYQSVKNDNIYLFSFLIISCCFFMTESVLEREKGIVFFTYFSLLLTCKNR
jgi:O-antigen ligase